MPICNVCWQFLFAYCVIDVCDACMCKVCIWLIVTNFSTRTWYNEPKVVVDLSKLRELLGVCHQCASPCTIENISEQGAYVRYRVDCQSCRSSRQWANSDKGGKTPLINLQLSAGIAYTGSLPTKFLRTMKLLNIKAPTPRVFHHYQTKYLHGVSSVLFEHQLSMLLVNASSSASNRAILCVCVYIV